MAEPQQRVSVWLPIVSEEWPMLTAAFPMSQQDWNQMLAVLEAMRPGLVAATTQPAHKEHGDHDE